MWYSEGHHDRDRSEVGGGKKQQNNKMIHDRHTWQIHNEPVGRSSPQRTSSASSNLWGDSPWNL